MHFDLSILISLCR